MQVEMGEPKVTYSGVINLAKHKSFPWNAFVQGIWVTDALAECVVTRLVPRIKSHINVGTF